MRVGGIFCTVAPCTIGDNKNANDIVGGEGAPPPPLSSFSHPDGHYSGTIFLGRSDSF